MNRREEQAWSATVKNLKTLLAKERAKLAEAFAEGERAGRRAALEEACAAVDVHRSSKLGLPLDNTTRAELKAAIRTLASPRAPIHYADCLDKSHSADEVCSLPKAIPDKE